MEHNDIVRTFAIEKQPAGGQKVQTASQGSRRGIKARDARWHWQVRGYLKLALVREGLISADS
ncbi:hypothetical protein RRG08_024528 [Elysia crispata]|uniref:Uncharacterized protein n=1 Tax=Elysia crispata TaxID=231223 RepID=A0AAE0Y7J6_9GAST|nr:hypothetical protein RRG08_024528 [Elysia crispata]